MKLSPLEIRKQEFSRAMRGYDVDEVRAFLGSLAGQMDDLINEQVRTDDELSDQKGKLGHLEAVQQALQMTLDLARRNAEETRETALQKAELILHEAQLKGEELFRRAEGELKKMQNDIINLESKRDQLLSRLRAVLNSELELLERFQPEPADRHVDDGVRTAGLTYIDPKAREHAAALAAAQAGAAKAPAEPASEPPSEAPSQEIAEAIASLKAEVGEGDDAAEDVDSGTDADQLGEMQKIRRILDDLE